MLAALLLPIVWPRVLLRPSFDSLMEASLALHRSSEETEAGSSPVSSSPGLTTLQDAPTGGAHVAEILNTKHIADPIGPASGLQMCFASTTKGLIAIAI